MDDLGGLLGDGGRFADNDELLVRELFDAHERDDLAQESWYKSPLHNVLSCFVRSDGVIDVWSLDLFVKYLWSDQARGRGIGNHFIDTDFYRNLSGAVKIRLQKLYADLDDAYGQGELLTLEWQMDEAYGDAV